MEGRMAISGKSDLQGFEGQILDGQAGIKV